MRKMKTAELMSDNKKYVFAHRGGSIENPENTMQAFKASNKLGAIIETDVRCTKDGQVVVCHDADLGRITGTSQLVAETNFEDLQKQFTKHIWVEFGHNDYEVKDTDAAEVCTLE